MSDSILCRSCRAPLEHVVVDLGSSPLSNSYLDKASLQSGELTYPLCVLLCDQCSLVQLPSLEKPENIFSDYAYFSSFSDSWLDHCRRYVDMMVSRFELGSSSSIVEIASNDGYLLRYFARKGLPVLGIEPAANVARAAQREGIETLVDFFGEACARRLREQHRRADVLLGNNVLAHVPDLNDFVAGLEILLAPSGVLTMEFPHLVEMIDGNQFDTIYHEHFSYFSLHAVSRVFERHGLALFDVEQLPTHGGSLRVFVQHRATGTQPINERVEALLEQERSRGVDDRRYYSDFSDRVHETKRRLLEFLIAAKRDGKSIVGYGAPAKGNTLLTYCGIRTDFIDYTVDRSPHKQGHYLPGSRIPILHPDRIRETRPDYVLILPWNLRDEITAQLADIHEWGARFVLAIPTLTVIDSTSQCRPAGV